MIGARFALTVRGFQDGWIEFEAAEGELIANMAFAKDTQFGSDFAERVWEQYRRIYDKVLLPEVRSIGDSQ